MPSSLSQPSAMPSETATHWFEEQDAPLAEQSTTPPEQLSWSFGFPSEFTAASSQAAAFPSFFTATSYFTDSDT